MKIKTKVFALKQHDYTKLNEAFHYQIYIDCLIIIKNETTKLS